MTIDFYLNRIICGDCLTVMREMQEKTYQLFNEDCRVGIKKLPDHSIDFIVTDPPYFIDGMDDTWNDKKLKSKAAKSGVIGSPLTSFLVK